MNLRMSASQVVLVATLALLIAAMLVLTVIILNDRPAAPVILDRAAQARGSFAVAHDEALSPAAVTLDRVVLRLEPGKPWKGTFSARGGLSEKAAGGHLIFILPPTATVDRSFMERFYLRGRFPRTQGVVHRFDDRVQVTLPFAPADTPLPEASAIDFEVDFRWSNPEVRSLGTGREQFALRYGAFMRTLTGLETGTLAGWIAFGGGSGFHTSIAGGPPELDVQIHLSDPNDRFVDPSPPPTSGGFNEKEWTSTSLFDDLIIETVTENEWTRHKLDLLTNLLFTLIGLIFGEAFGYLIAVGAHRRAADG
jgi:hypothetical protein